MSIESMEKFSKEVKRLVDYFASEFNMTYAECIGVLQMTVMDLHAQSWEETSEEEEAENGE